MGRRMVGRGREESNEKQNKKRQESATTNTQAVTIADPSHPIAEPPSTTNTRKRRTDTSSIQQKTMRKKEREQPSHRHGRPLFRAAATCPVGNLTSSGACATQLGQNQTNPVRKQHPNPIELQYIETNGGGGGGQEIDMR